uniref:Uncharacterized protein n=1 Tax=viral metagenome TaxID=1070528 RepID=A0A6C0B049_9ZZZZ
MSEEERNRETLTTNAILAIYEEYPDVNLEDIGRVFDIMIKYCNIIHPDQKVPYSVHRSMQACSVFDIRNKVIHFLSDLENRKRFHALAAIDILKLIVGEKKIETAIEIMKNREAESPPGTPVSPSSIDMSAGLERSLSAPDGGKRRPKRRRTVRRKMRKTRKTKKMRKMRKNKRKTKL